MKRLFGLAALFVLAAVTIGAGWSSRRELGDRYRSTVRASDGDTIYFAHPRYDSVSVLGTGGGSAVADSSIGVSWIMWARMTGTGPCSLAIFTDAAPAGVDTVVAVQGNFLMTGIYGGVAYRITKVACMFTGTDVVQITGAD